jgi:NADPH-dependent curcumin reductase CurA
MKSRRVRLVARPKGLPLDSDFQIEEFVVNPHLEAGQVLVRTLYLSIDPSMRIWISGQKSYIDPVPLGGVMFGAVVAEVLQSNSSKLQVGDKVQGFFGWVQHAVVSDKEARKLPSDIPPELFLGVLGMNGMTAYFGLLDVGRPQAGETIVVSTAGGAVGSIVCQIARLKGLNVIGLAGSAEKCTTVVSEFGAHHCLNYNDKDLGKQLRFVCPNGVDIYFDNVGGAVLDTVLPTLNKYARIVACGAIASYNDPRGHPIFNYAVIVSKSIRMEGFIILDYAKRYGEAAAALTGWLQEGRLKHQEHIVNGLENGPAAIRLLFSGQNSGKVLVRVADLAARL